MMHMGHEELHESLQSFGASVASAVDRCRDSVAPVGGTEPVPVRPGQPGSTTAPTRAGDGDEWPSEPDEAWSDDPDAYYEEVVDYMKRLHARCESSDEFVAALVGLFPGLEKKVAEARALAAEDLGDDDAPDPDADIAAGRGVTYLSSAEFRAALMARMADPVRD